MASLPNSFTANDITNYPALTVGLSVFTFLLLIFDVSGWLSEKFSLFPHAPFEFDLNRLSFYLLFHRGFLHWALNVAALVGPMALFERTHGTVHTGITLNLLAVVTGLQYCIVGLLLYPSTHVVGLSGIVFSFFSYVAYKEHVHTPLYAFQIQGRHFSIPTLWTPFAFLAITFLLLPDSSLFGHLFGISAGYLLAAGYLRVLYPPSKVVLWIEKKLAGPISKLDSLVTFYHESEAVDARGVAYSPIFTSDAEAGEPVVSPFRSEGHVLGA